MFTKKQPPFQDAVCLTTVYNAVDGPMIQGFLQSEGIPSLMRPKYGLDPLPVLAGSSVLGQEIYVEKSRLEEAKAVLDAFTGDHFAQEDASHE